MESQKHRLDSSTEELTLEQKLLLSSSKRQEPQGEEHTCRKGHHANTEKSKSMSTRGETPPSSQSSTASSSSSFYDEDEDHSSRPTKKNPQSSSSCGSGPRKNRNMSLDSNSHSAYNTLIIHQNTSSLLADTWIPASHEFTSVGMGNNRSSTSSSGGGNISSVPNNNKSRKSVSPSRMVVSSENRNSQNSNLSYRKTPPNPYENITMSDQGNNSGNTTSSELSDIPRDYLNQLTVLKHLAKEVQQDPISGTSPGDLLRSASFSKSQPDLTQSVGLSIVTPSSTYDPDRVATSSRPEPQQPLARRSKKQSGGVNSKRANSPSKEPKHSQSNQTGEEVLPSVQILEILMRENSNLKAELINARRKISTIHKMEAELSRLQASHSALFEINERRESLERSARVKLSSELKRLTAVNRELLSSSTSLQNLSPNPLGSDVEILKRELSNKDMTLAQLISQNKELATTKERQDVELAAQRATLAEQRTHIDILDSALTSAQGNVLRLEEECGKKQEYAEKASNLQRALSSLQVSNEKREQSEKKLRAQLETEITDLKLRLASMNANQPAMCWNMSQSQNQGTGCQSPPPYPGAGQTLSHQHNHGHRNYDSNEGQLKLLQDKLKVSEEHILNLNTQVSKWEHVFDPNNGGGGGGGGFRKHSISTPNTPNSWTNSTSRAGTPHFFGGHHSEKTSSDELLSISQTHHRANDLEWKIKDLESRLIEKDALIRILQSVPSSSAGSSPLLFSSPNSSSMPMMTPPAPPTYRDSPGYSMTSTVVASGGGNFTPNSSGGSSSANGMNANMASILDQHYANVHSTSMAHHAAQQLYAKLEQKCESEPPNYANLPLKLRLGGSGSSLVKNSNESLQSGGGGGGGGGGISPNVSGPGSVSSTSGASGSGCGVGGKSIDDQLKELDSQLLSKGGPGSLKIHSGLCCIPGFSHSDKSLHGTSTRKGKISQPLLESMSHVNSSALANSPYSAAASGGTPSLYSGGVAVRASTSTRQPMTTSGSIHPPLPKPPPSTYQTQNHGSQGQARTSSGPPFISSASAAALSAMNSSITTTMSLSNSVDSILSDQSPGKNSTGGNLNGKGGGNVFTPVVGMPKGLPPKSPPGILENSTTSSGKSRSLERSKPNEPCAGKYTVMMYDQTRCRSLDRREAKKEKAEKNLQSSQEKKAEKEKTGNLKSSVSSKAAFFGQLLSRRSPSPSREKEKDKDKEKYVKESQIRSNLLESNTKQHITCTKGQNQVVENLNKTEFEGDLDALLLDKQGRSSQSQRNRISSKWSSSNTLESVQELSGSESPWSQRKNSEGGGGGDGTSREMIGSGSNEQVQSQQSQKIEKIENEDSGKKWGRIVKTPFGLRYTFGSPRVASSCDNFRK